MHLTDHPDFPTLVQAWRDFIAQRGCQVSADLDAAGTAYDRRLEEFLPRLLPELLVQRPDLVSKRSLLIGVGTWLGEAVATESTPWRPGQQA